MLTYQVQFIKLKESSSIWLYHNSSIVIWCSLNCFSHIWRNMENITAHISAQLWPRWCGRQFAWLQSPQSGWHLPSINASFSIVQRIWVACNYLLPWFCMHLGEDDILTTWLMLAQVCFDLIHPHHGWTAATPLVLSSLVKLRQSTGSHPPEVTD